MLCSDPFVKGTGEAFPCGKCLACLKRWREVWTHRLMLENLACRSVSAFVTLTYAEDTLPKDMCLQPAHLQGFMKRLREHYARKERRTVRFFGVGEYGDQTQRPHYHVLLFGYASCLNGQSQYGRHRTSCCSQCDRIRDVWGFGHVGLGSVTHQSVRYVCGYMTKNMRHRHDSRLKGRHPEFSLKSTRPGIGYPALAELTETILEYGLDKGEVVTHLRHGDIKRPLGRYLRGKVAEWLQMEKGGVDEEVQALWDSACAAAPVGGEVRRTLFKNMLIDAADQRMKNLESRMKIKAKRASL